MGEGSYWRDVSVACFTYSVKGIFKFFLSGLAEIACVYAVFSPVLPGKFFASIPPLALFLPRHNYMLCFHFPQDLYHIGTFSPTFLYPNRSVLGDYLLPTRDDAWKLLTEFTQSESLRKHMLAVEACVRAYARKNSADEDFWGIAALLHDFDYERFPNNDHAPDREHPAEGAKILREHGYPEEMVRAILSHADYSGVPRQTPLEHTLFACDELAGFLTACSYIRPSKSILDLEVSSVKKRLKDKAFARGVSRDDVIKGAAELNVPLDDHIAFCIEALRAQADQLGLRGTL